MGGRQAYLEAVLLDHADGPVREWSRLCGAVGNIAGGRRRGQAWERVLRDEKTLQDVRLLAGHGEGSVTVEAARPVVQSFVNLGRQYRWAKELAHRSETAGFFALCCAIEPTCERDMVGSWLALFEADPMASAVLVHWGGTLLDKIVAATRGGDPHASDGHASEQGAGHHYPSDLRGRGILWERGSQAGPVGDRAAAGSAGGNGGPRIGGVELDHAERATRDSINECKLEIARLEAERGPGGEIGSKEYSLRALAGKQGRRLLMSVLTRLSPELAAWV